MRGAEPGLGAAPPPKLLRSFDSPRRGSDPKCSRIPYSPFRGGQVRGAIESAVRCFTPPSGGVRFAERSEAQSDVSLPLQGESGSRSDRKRGPMFHSPFRGSQIRGAIESEVRCFTPPSGGESGSRSDRKRGPMFHSPFRGSQTRGAIESAVRCFTPPSGGVRFAERIWWGWELPAALGKTIENDPAQDKIWR